jgi:hypothetical protein
LLDATPGNTEKMRTNPIPFLSLIILLAQSSCVNVSKGLIASYPFSGNTNDLGPHKLHGSLHGPELVADRNNEANAAYYFDGTDYIEVANDTLLNFDNDFTLVAWINMAEAKKMGSRIIDKQVGSTNYGFLLDTYTADYGGNGIRLFVGDAWKYKAKSTLSLNQWHLIVGTYKDGVGKIYIDGVLDSENSSTIKKIRTSNTPMRFGFDTGVRKGADFDDSFKGKIDDIRIYNRALSLKEIRKIYRN